MLETAIRSGDLELALALGEELRPLGDAPADERVSLRSVPFERG